MECSIFNRHLDHLKTLAKVPGWKPYAWRRATELEADETGIWTGISAALTRDMLASFGPANGVESGHPRTEKPRSPGAKFAMSSRVGG